MEYNLLFVRWGQRRWTIKRLRTRYMRPLVLLACGPLEPLYVYLGPVKIQINRRWDRNTPTRIRNRKRFIVRWA